MREAPLVNTCQVNAHSLSVTWKLTPQKGIATYLAAAIYDVLFFFFFFCFFWGGGGGGVGFCFFYTD